MYLTGPYLSLSNHPSVLRTAKPSHDSLVHLPAEVADLLSVVVIEAAMPVGAAATVEATWVVAAWEVVVWVVVWEVVLVSSTSPMFVNPCFHADSTRALGVDIFQLPFNVGWQDLKDLFRQAGLSICAPSYFLC